MYFIVSIFLIGLGALMFFSPQTWFDLTESWKSYSTEPSKLFVFSTRFGGAMFALVGISYIVVTLMT